MLALLALLLLAAPAPSHSTECDCCSKSLRSFGFMFPECATDIVTNALATSGATKPSVWYTTSIASSVVNANGLVSQWVDSTGNGYDIAGVTGKMPYYETVGSESFVRWGRVTAQDSANNRVFQTGLFSALPKAPPSIAQPFTVLLKMRFNELKGGYVMDSALDQHAFHVDLGTKFHLFPTTGGSYRAGAYITTACGYTNASAWGIYEWTFSSEDTSGANTANNWLKIMKADGSAPCISNSAEKMSNGDAALGQLTLGDDGGLRNGVTPDISIKEFMIFPGVLSTTDRTLFRRYLDAV